MPTFQVTCRELVYVDRTYEIEAEDAEAARVRIAASHGDEGELVDELVQDSHDWCGVKYVHDMNGNQAWPARRQQEQG